MAKVDYRREYEKHLGFILPKEMHVHHLDHNRENNGIQNLVAIPSELHGRYHFLERQLHLHSNILRYRLPSKKILLRYSFNSYLTGEWRLFFKGSESDFLQRVNNYCGLVRGYEMYESTKLAYLETKKLILDYKKQQSKKLKHGNEKAHNKHQ